MASDPIQNPLIKCQVPLTSVDFKSRPYVFLKQISIPFNKALLTCLNLCVVHEPLFMAGGVDHLLRTATRSGSAKFSLKSKGHFLLLLSSLETVASPYPIPVPYRLIFYVGHPKYWEKANQASENDTERGIAAMGKGSVLECHGSSCTTQRTLHYCGGRILSPPSLPPATYC